MYAFLLGVAVVILVKRAPAGRSTRETAPLPKVFALRLTCRMSGCVGGGVASGAVDVGVPAGTGSAIAGDIYGEQKD